MVASRFAELAAVGRGEQGMVLKTYLGEGG